MQFCGSQTPRVLQAARAMALVLAFNYVDKLSFFYIQTQLAQMSSVVALVFGQSRVRSWWLAICGAHVKRWTLQLKF